jgi:transcriptional regulator with XRE-family HTH domain
MNLREEVKLTNWTHDEDRQEFAIEALAMSVQFALQKAMKDNHITQKTLAARLGVSAPRVSQILAGDAVNLTLKTIGKIADALGEEFELFSQKDLDALKAKAKAKEKSEDAASLHQIRRFPKTRNRDSWTDQSTANEQRGVNVVDFYAFAACQ